MVKQYSANKNAGALFVTNGNTATTKNWDGNAISENRYWQHK